MERNVQRINGEIERLHRLSDDELDNHMMHALNRLADTQTEIDHLLFEKLSRVGGVAIQEELDFTAGPA